MVKASLWVYCLNEIYSNNYEHACLISNASQCCVFGQHGEWLVPLQVVPGLVFSIIYGKNHVKEKRTFRASPSSY